MHVIKVVSIYSSGNQDTDLFIKLSETYALQAMQLTDEIKNLSPEVDEKGKCSPIRLMVPWWNQSNTMSQLNHCPAVNH